MYILYPDSQSVVFENMKNFTLRSSAGTIRSRSDFKFETANFQVGSERPGSCPGVVLFSPQF